MISSCNLLKRLGNKSLWCKWWQLPPHLVHEFLGTIWLVNVGERMPNSTEFWSNPPLMFINIILSLPTSIDFNPLTQSGRYWRQHLPELNLGWGRDYDGWAGPRNRVVPDPNSPPRWPCPMPRCLDLCHRFRGTDLNSPPHSACCHIIQGQGN